jgi:hypothetical protein
VLVHLSGYAAWYLARPPALDIDLELEDDLSFGLTDMPITVDPLMNDPAAATMPPSEAPPSAPESAPADEEGWGLPKPDAALPPPPDAAIPDAAIPDAAPKKKPKKPEPDAAPASEAPKTDAAPASEAPKPDAAPASEAPTPDAGPPVVASAEPPSDAPKPDAGPPVVGSTAPGDAGPPAAPGPRPPAGLAAQAPSGAVSLPAGAQIALRLDLALIRSSPLASEAAALLAAIPDWQRLLGGSDVNPIDVLDRVLIATPSLRQDHMVLAGALTVPDPKQLVVRRAVDALAKARGVPAPWEKLDEWQVAPWANPDDTPRHIALLSDRHFAIGQITDLPTVLALAKARVDAQQAAAPSAPATLSPTQVPDAGPPAPPPVTGPDVLLWMPADTVVSGEVDGARRLVRGHSKLVPERLRLALVTLPEERVGLEAEANYQFRDEAQAAVDALEGLRRRLLGDPVIGTTLRVMGLAATLAATQVEIVDDTRLYARFELTYPQVRAIMVYLRTSLEARAKRLAEAAAAAASAPPSVMPVGPAGPPSGPASSRAPGAPPPVRRGRSPN